jgi:3-deoxy-7-phosphoheptulonate synthase
MLKASQFAISVMTDVADQIAGGNQSIIGFMLESHINAGNQKVPEDISQLAYGVSITDACVDWETTEKMIRNLRDKVKPVLADRTAPALASELKAG